MSAAGTLAFKLVLTPVLVGAASLAGRRWGSAVGGWLVGIPFTSGPIAFFLALDPGPHFAAVAAAGIMAGTGSQAAFCLAYSWTAQRLGWVASLSVATLAFAIVTAMLDALAFPALFIFVVMVGVLAVSLVLMPRLRSGPAGHLPTGGQEHIAARMVVATAFVIALTSAAPLLGARLAGLLAPFPLYATVLTTFAHRHEGAGPAVGVLRGLLLGLFAFAGFFLALAELLDAQGIVVAFAAASLLALLVQGLTLFVGRRWGLA